MSGAALPRRRRRGRPGLRALLCALALLALLTGAALGQDDAGGAPPAGGQPEAPTDSPEQTPEGTPEGAPEEAPEAAPEQTPEQAPEQAPEQVPGGAPEQASPEAPGGAPTEGGPAIAGAVREVRVDTSGGPLTLQEDVQAALDAWAEALGESLPLELVDDTGPEVSVIGFDDAALFGPDTVSLTLQPSDAPTRVLLNPSRYRQHPALLHEVGVLLGLPESPTAPGVMDPSFGPDAALAPSVGDREAFNALRDFVPADLTRDGVVDFYDLVAFSEAFGTRGVNLPADLDGNGAVDRADLELLRASYSFTPPSPQAPDEAGGDLVPEDDAPLPEVPGTGDLVPEDDPDDGTTPDLVPEDDAPQEPGGADGEGTGSPDAPGDGTGDGTGDGSGEGAPDAPGDDPGDGSGDDPGNGTGEGSGAATGEGAAGESSGDTGGDTGSGGGQDGSD